MNLPFDCQLVRYKVGSHAVASVLHNVSLIFQCVLRKCEVGERFEPKLGGGRTAFTCILWHSNNCR